MSAVATARWMRIPDADGAAGLALARSACGSLLVQVAGFERCLRPSGALWLAAERTLVVADLHLEKGSAYAARGQLLPPFDTRATLDRLEAEIEALSPAVVVLLGDSFHDARAVARLATEDAARIAGLARGRTLVWVVGNHDEDGPGALPGDVVDEVEIGFLTLRHEPSAGRVAGEVAGHLHPCAKLVAYARSVRRRCFLTDGERLILPAFGSYAGGLNALDPAFSGLFARPPIAAALGVATVHPLKVGSLVED